VIHYSSKLVFARWGVPRLNRNRTMNRGSRSASGHTMPISSVKFSPGRTILSFQAHFGGRGFWIVHGIDKAKGAIRLWKMTKLRATPHRRPIFLPLCTCSLYVCFTKKKEVETEVPGFRRVEFELRLRPSTTLFTTGQRSPSSR